MQALLIVERTHLLGKEPETLLVACTLDNNNKLLHIAYAVVENERIEMWIWLLSLAREQVFIHPRESEYQLMTILFDKQKGLLPAVRMSYLKRCMDFA